MVAVPRALFVSLVVAVRQQRPTVAVRPDGPAQTRSTLGTTATVVNPRGFVQTSRSTPACDDFKSFQWDHACSVDEFVEHAWVIALSVDCQLAKGQNILDAAAEDVYQADKRHREGLQAAPLPTFNTLAECPAAQCETCAGLRFGSSQDGRGVLLFPSPKSEGTTYAYDGERRVLTNTAEVTSVQPARIDAAMQYAFLHGYAINYSNQEHYFLSQGIQEELRFVGHDPQMIVTLQPHYTNASAAPEDMCVGAAVGRLIDLPSYEKYFSGTSAAVVPEEAHSFWSEAHPDADGSTFKVTGSKVAVDAMNKPVGTIHLDIDVDRLVQRYLEPGSLATDVYAFLVNSEGHILGANENTFAVLFNTELTRAKFRNPDDVTICKRKDRKVDSRKCTFQTPRSLDLNEVLRREGFSQANFTGILAAMFGESTRGQTICSKKVGEDQVHFPHANLHHTVAFCTFGTFPSWGLIFGTAPGSFEHAAEIVVNTSKLHFNIRTQEGSAGELLDLPPPQFIEVSTEGNVRLDYEIELPHSFVIANPASGTVRKGEKVVVQLKVTQESFKSWLDYRERHSTEEEVDTGIATAHTMKDVDEVFTQVYIKPDREWPRATCFHQPGTVSILLRHEVALSSLSKLVKGFGKTMACILAIILVGLLMYLMWKMLKQFIRRMEEEQATLQRARESVHQLSFPMALVSFETFKTWKRLISHEDAEARHHLIWLYTTDEVSACFESKYIVFVSHQWTSFTEPDPERPDDGGHVQYNAMVMSIESVIQKNNVKLDHKDIYVWVDYACIPQKHRGLQTLAIHSLTVYAANVHAFVVVAPRVQHANLVTDEGNCIYCDKDSYQGRAWCRAEQLSHILARGRKNMYLAEGDKLSQLEDEWLDQSIMVFAGDMTCCRLKHEGMEKCDKQRLVVPMLGLYAQLCRTCADIEYVKDPEFSKEQPEAVEEVKVEEEDLGEELQAIKAKIDSQLHTVFPPRFLLKRGKTEKEVELFGGLVEKVRDQSYEGDPSQSATDGKDGEDDDSDSAKVSTVPPLRTGGATSRSTRSPPRTGQPSRSTEPPLRTGVASGAATSPKP